MNNEATRRKTEQGAELLSQCLDHFFEAESAREHQIRVMVEGREFSPYQAGRGVEWPLRFELPSGSQVEGRLLINSTGGNVYEVSSHLEGEAPETHSVTLPELELPAEQALKYCRAFCDQLLARLERRVGEQSLREATKRRTDESETR